MSIEATGALAPAAAQAQPASVAEAAKVSSLVADKPSIEKVDPSEAVAKLEASIQKLNDLMATGQRSLNFSVDKSSDSVVVKVVDTQTDEVIRQIPNEESLRLAEYIEGMVGVIFNRSA